MCLFYKGLEGYWAIKVEQPQISRRFKFSAKHCSIPRSNCCPFKLLSLFLHVSLCFASRFNLPHLKFIS